MASLTQRAELSPLPPLSPGASLQLRQLYNPTKLRLYPFAFEAPSIGSHWSHCGAYAMSLTHPASDVVAVFSFCVLLLDLHSWLNMTRPTTQRAAEQHSEDDNMNQTNRLVVVLHLPREVLLWNSSILCICIRSPKNKNRFFFNILINKGAVTNCLQQTNSCSITAKW